MAGNRVLKPDRRGCRVTSYTIGIVSNTDIFNAIKV
jgi:hypothetical protein